MKCYNEKAKAILILHKFVLPTQWSLDSRPNTNTWYFHMVNNMKLSTFTLCLHLTSAVLLINSSLIGAVHNGIGDNEQEEIEKPEHTNLKKEVIGGTEVPQYKNENGKKKSLDDVKDTIKVAGKEDDYKQVLVIS